MTNKQIVKLSKNRTVIKYLTGFIEIMKTIPMFNTLFEGLLLNMQAIENTAALQEENKKGVTRDKTKVRRRLEKQTLTMSKVMCSFAVSQANNTLYEMVYCTKSHLEVQGDEDLLLFCRTVVKEASNYFQELTDYSVSKEVIKDYSLMVDEFAGVIADPQIIIKEGKNLSASLVALFKENDIIHKKKMAPLAMLFKDSYPEFYAGYVLCLKEKDPRTVNSKAAGAIKDTVTGKLLHGVQVRAEGTTYIAISSRNGRYQLKIPDPGFYTLVFELEGYQPVILKDVEIRLGQTVSFAVEMQPVK